MIIGRLRRGDETPGSHSAATRGKLALLSFVLGLFFCIPPAPFASLIFGVAALRSARPQRGGRPLAFVGIALSLGGIAFVGWFVYTSFILARPAADFTRQFVSQLSSHQISAAQARCEADVHPDDVKRWAAAVQALGPVRQVGCTTPLYQSCPTRQQLALTLEATVKGAGGSGKFFVCLARREGRFFVIAFNRAP